MQHTKDFKLIKREDIEYFICPQLEQYNWLIHAFTTRCGGVSSLPEKALNLTFGLSDKRENVIKNREKVLKALDIPYNFLITIKQEHGKKVVSLKGTDSKQDDTRYIGDAIITDQSELALAIQVADCFPIFIVDGKKKVIANIHAGWRSVIGGIISNMVEIMKMNFDCQEKDLLAAVGPGIGACCYEVGGEVIEKFRELSPQGGIFWKPASSGYYFLDLLGVIKEQIHLQGLKSKQIKALELCTACHPDLFFSYRKEGERSGRMMGIISKLAY